MVLNSKNNKKMTGQLAVSNNGPSPKSKITDFFPIRRSKRKTVQTIKEEKQQMLVQAILEGRQEGLKSKKIPNKGRGVVTLRPFVKNEFVVEYAGELLDMNSAKKREKKYGQDRRVGCYMFYFTNRDQKYCVDATEESDRLGRLINHSRNGNLKPKVIEVKGLPRLIFIAKRNIDVNEELTYDYGDRRKEALINNPWLAD